MSTVPWRVLALVTHRTIRDRHRDYFRRGGWNRASNEARKRGRHVDVDDVPELREPRRTIVWLRATADWPYEDTAELLGKSADAVKTQYFRAKRQLREQMERARSESEEPTRDGLVLRKRLVMC